MTEAALQQEYVSTLKTLNNAIVTIRTFPANAPQVTNAVERGYKIIKEHLRKRGDFSISRVGDDFLLCGEILSEGTIRSISNLIVYRQLELLGSKGCVVQPGLDRKTFKKLLEVFSAKVNQIKNEGGGLAFTRSLGLEKYFFAEKTAAGAAQPAKEDFPGAEQKTADVPKVRKELVDVLLGRETRRSIIDELVAMLKEPEKGVPVFITALGGILEGLRQNKVFANSAALNQILANYEKLAGEDDCRQFMLEAADLALHRFDLSVLALLMSQSFQVESGRVFSELLLQRISFEEFAGVIKELRKKSSRLRLTEAGDSRPLQFLNGAVKMLLDTPKGKQYLGKEKAQSLLDAGEKARKAQRVQAGVRSLVQGNIEVLSSEEFIEHLPSVLQKMASDNMKAEVQDVLEKLSAYFAEVSADDQLRLIGSMLQIGENLLSAGLYDEFEKIADPLLIWLRDSDNADQIYERACVCLQNFMGHSWQVGKERNGDKVLSMLYRIRSGKLNKSDKVRDIVGRVQDRYIDNGLLDHLLGQCLENPKDEVVSRRLILQGPIASRFLVERLMTSEQAGNRFKIIDLLTYGEQFLPDIIIEKLAEPTPWYGKRNLLKLLAETGREEHAEVAFPYLQHEDMRVQREAFNCIYKISGDQHKKALLRGLSDAAEAMKLQIIKALAPMCDNEVTLGLEQVLADYQYYSEEFRDTLLVQACQILGRCPMPEAERVLQGFLAQRNSRQMKRIADTVWTAVRDALAQLEETQRSVVRMKVKPGQLRLGVKRQADGEHAGEPRLITGLDEEKHFYELLAKGQTAPARELLISLIGSMARQKKFGQAEKLREQLIGMDQFALKDIIKASELIEDEKQTPVDKLSQNVWAELSDSLTTEEFSALYHALEKTYYFNEEILVQKGDEQRELYFINSGRVKLFYRKGAQEILIKVIKAGEILGAHTISDASSWTFSASSLGKTDIALLSLEQIQQWREHFPALESKLKRFCEQFENTAKFLELTNEDRREHFRESLEPTPVTLALLDEDERSLGVELRGELLDLSSGGLSLSMKIATKDNARLMLGRSIQLFLPYGEKGEKTITFHGQIVAVREKSLMDMQYSIHVKFFRELSEAQLEKVARLAAFRKVSGVVQDS